MALDDRSRIPLEEALGRRFATRCEILSRLSGLDMAIRLSRVQRQDRGGESRDGTEPEAHGQIEPANTDVRRSRYLITTLWDGFGAVL
jgi:hypothetical protein